MQLSGNRQIIANGVNTLPLTCISGTANPAATITWRNGQTLISSGITKSTSQGDFSGTVVTEKLTLKPTREMDGDVISCTTSNTVNQPVTVKKETSLDLKCKLKSIVTWDDFTRKLCYKLSVRVILRYLNNLFLINS